MKVGTPFSPSTFRNLSLLAHFLRQSFSFLHFDDYIYTVFNYSAVATPGSSLFAYCWANATTTFFQCLRFWALLFYIDPISFLISSWSSFSSRIFIRTTHLRFWVAQFSLHRTFSPISMVLLAWLFPKTIEFTNGWTCTHHLNFMKICSKLQRM